MGVRTDPHFLPMYGSFAALRAPDGELSARVRVLGDWLPRSIFGRAVALCSVVRMLYIALALCCVVGRVAVADAAADAAEDARVTHRSGAGGGLSRWIGLPTPRNKF